MNSCTLWFNHIGPWNWESCCRLHDAAYAIGIPRALADAQLAHCVDAILPGMGFLMWIGVTLFGGVFYLAARLRSRKR